MEKTYLWWIAKEIDWNYWKFLSLSVNVNELSKYADHKWFVRLTISPRKTPWKYWETHSIILNEYKAETKAIQTKDDIPFWTSYDKLIDKAKWPEINIEDLPF